MGVSMSDRPGVASFYLKYPFFPRFVKISWFAEPLNP